MGLDQYAHLRNRKIDWKKYYSDDEKESQTEQKDVFVWRKHARLQTFMNRKFEEQNAEQLKKQREEEKDKDFNPMDLSHLGMNGYDEVYITEDVVKDLEKEVKSNYHNSFCADGFFWGHEWQNETARESVAYDLDFCTKALAWLQEGRKVWYSCWW